MTAETSTGGRGPLDGLDDLGAEWVGWAVELAIFAGGMAYCAWQLRGCFRQALDVARGWRLAAAAAAAVAVAENDAVRPQAAADGAGESDRL